MTTITLNFSCHVSKKNTATTTVTVDGVDHEFTMLPTLDWVPSSTADGVTTISVDLEVPNKGIYSKTFKFKITAKDSDVFVCGYDSPGAAFAISSQPIWNDPAWRPYDITGHTGDNPEFEGTGGLQILAGQTVEFDGTISANHLRAIMLERRNALG